MDHIKPNLFFDKGNRKQSGMDNKKGSTSIVILAYALALSLPCLFYFICHWEFIAGRKNSVTKKHLRRRRLLPKVRQNRNGSEDFGDDCSVDLPCGVSNHQSTNTQCKVIPMAFTYSADRAPNIFYFDCLLLLSSHPLDSYSISYFSISIILFSIRSVVQIESSPYL